MGQTFSITTTPPARRLAKAFGDAGAELADWKPAWKRFLPLIGPQQFETLHAFGAKLGKAWEPLDPKWVERKAKHGHHRAAGVFTGKLEADLMANVGRRSITKTRLRWGPKERYSYIFHHGVEGRQPARPFLGWTPEMTTVLFAILADRADDVLTRAIAAFEGGMG